MLHPADIRKTLTNCSELASAEHAHTHLLKGEFAANVDAKTTHSNLIRVLVSIFSWYAVKSYFIMIVMHCVVYGVFYSSFTTSITISTEIHNWFTVCGCGSGWLSANGMPYSCEVLRIVHVSPSCTSITATSVRNCEMLYCEMTFWQCDMLAKRAVERRLEKTQAHVNKLPKL